MATTCRIALNVAIQYPDISLNIRYDSNQLVDIGVQI